MRDQYEGGLGPEYEKLLHRVAEREAQTAERGIRAWLLAPTIDVYQALLRGEKVPAEKLNADALARYELKR